MELIDLREDNGKLQEKVLEEAKGVRRHYEPEQIIADSQSRIQELLQEKKKMQDELDYYRKLEVEKPTLRIVGEPGTPMSTNVWREEPETVDNLLAHITISTNVEEKKNLIEQFVDRAVAAEREACAKIADRESQLDHTDREGYTLYCCEETATKIAATIRARGGE